VRGRAAHTIALDDQVGAYLRGRGDAGATTREVLAAFPATGCTGYPHVHCRHLPYSAVYGSLRRHERAGRLEAFRDPCSGRRGGVLCVWRRVVRDA
jgi:hypothetical protein